jgi:dTDP-4-amino-4,6-dideoxygalactose transaminase
MGKRATDMTAEEHQAVIERMAKLREVANKKRMEMAAEKRGIKSDLKEAKAAELERKKELTATKRRNAEILEQELDKHKKVMVSTLPDEGASGEEEEIRPRRRAVETNPFEMYQMLTSMKAELKNKYKTKYAEKYAKPGPPPPTPQPPPPNPVRASARDVLKSKVDEEIHRMAYKSLFGSDL